MATLRKGSTGDEVLNLQKKLNTMGYNLAEDGIFGDGTYSAVYDLQGKNGLTQDGIVGDQTWTFLNGGASAQGNNNTSGTTQMYGISTPSAGNGLNGVSSETSEKLSLYEGGYTPSDKVNEAYAYLESIKGQKPGEYQSKWTDQLNGLYDQIMNRKDFSYDLNADALYQQYRDQYQSLGQQAMMDTMGQAAGLTGGYGSTYSQNAGQQAYNSYLQRLNDIVPDLYAQAYQRYMDEGNELLNQYDITMQNDQSDYGRYRDTVSDWYNNYSMANDAYNNEYNRDYTDYSTMFSYWQNRSAQENADYWNAYNAAQQREQWEAEMELARQQAASRSSGGGSGGSGSGGGGNSGLTEQEIKLIQRSLGVTQDGVAGNDTMSALKAAGYTSLADAKNKIITSPREARITVTDTIANMANKGASKDDIKKAIKEAYNTGAITSETYSNLMKKYGGR